MARKEKELHLQLYPGWSARDNYAVHAKKKKKRKDVLPGEKPRPDDRFMDNPAFGKYECLSSRSVHARSTLSPLPLSQPPCCYML